jgi:hypothetical protein
LGVNTAVAALWQRSTIIARWVVGRESLASIHGILLSIRSMDKRGKASYPPASIHLDVRPHHRVAGGDFVYVSE